MLWLLLLCGWLWWLCTLSICAQSTMCGRVFHALPCFVSVVVVGGGVVKMLWLHLLFWCW